MAPSPLAPFHPVIAEWFRERFGQPTEVQARAWPEIAAGRHVLVTAPTGSGKTLTAFLWALDRLFTGVWPAGTLRVLYVSPLKALNADIEANIERPLAELAARFDAAGSPVPRLRSAVRSGDTPPADRQRLIKHPPEILITTPESLNLLLTSKGGRGILDGLATVILDEIHAVAGSKRGTHLMTAVERLVPLSGDFQRVALSATVKPLERIARFVGGWELLAGGDEPAYRPRPVTVVRTEMVKRYDVRVSFPAELAPEAGEVPFWDRLVPALEREIRAHRSTLIFTNSRRTAEKLTRLLNEAAGRDFVYSHHGSLSKEVRSVVERRLKRGELPALVATSSLELGIDVGDLDEVLLVATPRSIASAIQRVGRAGHRVGEVSRGVFHPLFGRDFLDAAVVARAVLEQDIEPIQPIANPLDVLAQVLLSMLASETWKIEELWAFLRTADPYHTLPRRAFDLVLEQLAGRFAATRVRELTARVAIDRVAGTLRARPGAAQWIYTAGGTIPDRGYFTLRLSESMARLGELDEEFVWERSIGDTFTLGAQGWRISQITHNDVLVVPARGGAAMAPFWRADEQDRGAHLSERVGRFLEWADGEISRPGFAAKLAVEYPLDAAATAELVRLLERQRAATGGALPHRHHLLVERVREAGRPDGRHQVLLHTLWGGKVNRPLALAFAAAWEEANPGSPIDVAHDDGCILLVLPEDLPLDAILGLLAPEDLERLLRKKLEGTGYFGARFRENAGRALLLPRSGLRQRTPLWLSRQRAKKLLEAVRAFPDFPLLAETWRTCLEDELELEVARARLAELAAGEIGVSEVVTSDASPFAEGLRWKLTNTAMYDDDTPLGDARSTVAADLVQELLRAPHLRPAIPLSLVAELEAKRQRLHPGWAPREEGELVEWVKERLLLPEGEWRALLAACARDGLALDLASPALGSRLARVTLPGAEGPAVVALETLPRLARALDVEPGDLGLAGLDGPLPEEAAAALATLLSAPAPEPAAEGLAARRGELAALAAEWARFWGPFPPERLGALFGAFEERVRGVIEALDEERLWVFDRFTEGAEAAEVCDAENLETLLRWRRAASRPSFEALPLSALPHFWGVFQGLAGSEGTQPGSIDALKTRLEQLLGYPAPVSLWEGEILPARLSPYYPSWLDTLTQESELGWLGVGSERITFAFPADLELLRPAAGPDEADASAGGLLDLLAEPPGRWEAIELARRTGRRSAQLQGELWQLAWQAAAACEPFAALRRAALGRFQPIEEAATRPAAGARPGRFRFDRWQGGRAASGRWYALPGTAPPADAVVRDELAKERARLLLGRYGVVFRELVARELPAFEWRGTFRALRLMELSGEVMSGYFFAGIPGPQFASQAAFRQLRQGLPEDVVFWLGALDPASPCGLDLPDLKAGLPRRVPGGYLVYHGARKVVTARRTAAELELAVGPDHPDLPRYLGFLKVLLAREFDPERSLAIETINAEPAAKSRFLAALRPLFGVTSDGAGVKLVKRY
ncbi:MAG TPA: DEAD/DEAH box helicase [Thermoanaerobaculia bacterium]|nr:DEAD/DEAH box helicase [Thermoanaerobaculia bacterium]